VDDTAVGQTVQKRVEKARAAVISRAGPEWVDEGPLPHSPRGKQSKRTMNVDGKLSFDNSQKVVNEKSPEARSNRWYMSKKPSRSERRSFQ
jgi:hypothetical protein